MTNLRSTVKTNASFIGSSFEGNHRRNRVLFDFASSFVRNEFAAFECVRVRFEPIRRVRVTSFIVTVKLPEVSLLTTWRNSSIRDYVRLVRVARGAIVE